MGREAEKGTMNDAVELNAYGLRRILEKTFQAAHHLERAQRLLIEAEQQTPFGHPAKAILTEQYKFLYPKDELFLSPNRVIEALIKPKNE